MRGMESMLASMIGVDPIKMQEMMTGFIDNAAHLAKGVEEIKAGIASINQRLDAIEIAISISKDEGKEYVESDN